MKFTHIIHPRKLWSDLRSSLWFTPTFIIAVYIGLAGGALWLDHQFGLFLTRQELLFLSFSPTGALSILTVIATSMMTVAGVVFSITIVALTMASSQYSPRILRSFMRDQGNQTVLGIFVGTFTYCLTAMQFADFSGDLFESPLTLCLALLLSCVSIGFLIYFIHHIAQSIQVSHVVASIARDTMDTIRNRSARNRAAHQCSADFPESDPQPEQGQSNRWYRIRAHQSGYLQRVEIEDLNQLAKQQDNWVEVPHRIGDFIVQGDELLRIYLNDEQAEAEDVSTPESRWRQCVALSRARTIDQDVSFGLRLLVDIALKALSPGINDTTTAVMVLDHMTAVLVELFQDSKEPDDKIADNSRVWIQPVSDADYVDVAYHQIRQSAQSNPTIYMRLLNSLDRVGLSTQKTEACDAIKRHVQLTRATYQKEVAMQEDCEVLDRVKLDIEEASR